MVYGAAALPSLHLSRIWIGYSGFVLVLVSGGELKDHAVKGELFTQFAAE